MTGSIEPRTVGFLVDRWEPERGGAERALAALAQHLEGRGHRVLAFAASGQRDAPGELVRVRALGWTRASYERSLARALVRAARERGCDVTIGIRHLEQVDVYWPHGGAHAESLAARARSRAGSMDATSAPLSGRHRAFIDFERALLDAGGAKRVVCVSEGVRDELARAWPNCRQRLCVVENGVDLQRFHPSLRASDAVSLRRRLEIDEGMPLITFIAREPLLKGLPTLLEALGRLSARPWRLLIAGPRRLPYWRGRARAAGLGGSRLSLFRNLDSATLLPASDLLVHPTWRDPFPLVVLESLASGTPVITTRAAGAAHLIEEGVSGRVLDRPGDAQALTAAIEEELDRRDQAPVDREAVRASVAGHDASSWLERLESIVLEGSRARPSRGSNP